MLNWKMLNFRIMSSTPISRSACTGPPALALTANTAIIVNCMSAKHESNRPVLDWHVGTPGSSKASTSSASVWYRNGLMTRCPQTQSTDPGNRWLRSSYRCLLYMPLQTENVLMSRRLWPPRLLRYSWLQVVCRSKTLQRTDHATLQILVATCMPRTLSLFTWANAGHRHGGDQHCIAVKLDRHQVGMAAAAMSSYRETGACAKLHANFVLPGS